MADLVAVIQIGAPVVAAAGVIATILRSDRQRSRQDGQQAELIRQHGETITAHTARMNNHAERLGSLERARVVTWPEHDEVSRRCREEVDKQVAIYHTRMEKIAETVATGEDRRQEYREQDNKRWSVFESAIGEMRAELRQLLKREPR